MHRLIPDGRNEGKHRINSLGERREGGRDGEKKGRGVRVRKE